MLEDSDVRQGLYKLREKVVSELSSTLGLLALIRYDHQGRTFFGDLGKRFVLETNWVNL